MCGPSGAGAASVMSYPRRSIWQQHRPSSYPRDDMEPSHPTSPRKTHASFLPNQSPYERSFYPSASPYVEHQSIDPQHYSQSYTHTDMQQERRRGSYPIVSTHPSQQRERIHTHPHMEKSTVPTPSEQGDSGVRRPMNSFLIFAREHRTTVQREHPGKDNKAISKVLGDMWFNLSQDERLPFILKAKAIADQHRKDHPNFRYRKGGKTTAKPRTVSTASTTRPAGGNESAEWAMVQNSQQHGERMRPTGWDESSRWEEHDIIRYSRPHELTHARPEWEGYTEEWESPPSFPSRRMSQSSSGPVINRSLSHGHSSMQSSPSIPSIEYGHAPPSPIFPLHTSKATGESNHQSRMEVPYAQTRRYSDPPQPVWNGKAREDSLEPHPVYYTNTAFVPPRYPAHYENPTRRTSGPGPERSPRSQNSNTHPYESTRRQSEPYQLLASRPRAWRGVDRSPTSLPESIPDPVWNSNSVRNPEQSEIVERSRSSSWGDIYTASTFLGAADRDDWLEDVKGLSLRKVGSNSHSTESRTPPPKENSSGARKSGLWSVDSLL